MTLDALAQTTLSMIGRAGLQSITMRAVAAELGVRAASLYHHVADKEALLDLVLNEVGNVLGPQVVGQYEDVRTPDEWIDVTRRITLLAYDFHAQHPGIASLMLQRSFSAAAASSTIASIARKEVEALIRSGLPEPEAARVYQACARWTLAEIAAETSEAPATPAARRDLFVDGFELLLDGIRHRILRIDVRALHPPRTHGR